MYKITAKSNSAHCLREESHTCQSFGEAIYKAHKFANHKNNLARNGYLYLVTLEDTNTRESIAIKSGCKIEEIYF